MSEKLVGAYVQAWVWVDLDVEGDQEPSLGEIRQLAQRTWSKDGEIEVDDTAAVSRSYEEG